MLSWTKAPDNSFAVFSVAVHLRDYEKVTVLPWDPVKDSLKILRKTRNSPELPSGLATSRIDDEVCYL